MAPFCIVLAAVLCLTVNMAHPAAATDPDDEDFNLESDEDDSSHENHAQNFTHPLGHRNHSSSRTTTTEEPDEDYQEPDMHVATAHPNLITRLPETVIHLSAGVSTVTSFQVLTSTVLGERRLDFSQASQPQERIYSIVIPERSNEGVPESSSSLGFIGTLQPVFSDSPISVFLSSGFITSEAVSYETATHKTAHNTTLSASFISSIHDTNFLMSRSSDGTRSLSTTLVVGDFLASLPGTTEFHSASVEFRQGESITSHDETSSVDQSVSSGNILVSPSSWEAVNAYLSYVTENYEPRYHSDYDFENVHRSSLTENILMAWTANEELAESTVTTEAIAAEHSESTATGQADSRITDLIGSAVTEHAQSTFTEHAQSTFTRHTEPTVTEHAQSTLTEHAEPTVTEHAQSTFTEHNEPIITEHAQSTFTEHAEPTVTEHAQSTFTEHAEPTVTEHAQSTFTEHAEPTFTEHAQSTFTEHAEPTVTEHAQSTFTEHAERTVTEHAQSTFTRHTESTIRENAQTAVTEHVESATLESTESRTIGQTKSSVTEHIPSTVADHTHSSAIEHAQSTVTEHAELTIAEYTESRTIEQAESTVIEHFQSTVTEHLQSTVIEHFQSTVTEHLQSTVIEHFQSTVTEHLQSTVIEHFQSTVTEHLQSTVIEHFQSTVTEHLQSTVTEHTQSVVTEHAQSIITEHAESTITEHAQFTVTEHARSIVSEYAESTNIERTESTGIEHTESRSTEYIQSNITEQDELASTEQAESALPVLVESASTSIEIWVFSSQSSPQHLPHTLPETPTGLGLGLSTYFTLSSGDVTGASWASGGVVLVSSTGGVSLMYGDFSQGDETAQRESSTGTSSHECSNCSSSGHSLEGITSTSIQTPESNTFPGDLTLEISTFGMSTWFSLTSSHTHVESPSLIDLAVQTAIHPDGSEVQLSSTFSSPQLLTSRDIRESSSEQTATTTSLYDLSEVHISSNYSSQDTADSYLTSTFYSSLHLNEASRFSSHAVLHTEESMFSSRNDTPSIMDTLPSSVHDIPSIIDSVDTSTYDTFDRSGIIRSLGYDTRQPSESIETSTHDSRHGLEVNDTSIHHLLHSTEDVAASGYETLPIDGSLIPSSNIFSSHREQYSPTTRSMDLERNVARELSETLSEVSQSVQSAVYLSSSLPDSSTSIGTELLLQTTLTHPRVSVPGTITVFSKWESGRSDAGIAGLSSTLASIATAEGASIATVEGALTSGQGLPATPSATADTRTEHMSSWLTRSFLETSFSPSIDLQRISTSILGDFLTSTTLISPSSTIITQIATNTTTSATTVKATTPQTETSTEVIHTVPSNFTIVIYFDGDCERAHEKKYTGILNAKMQQLIRNISQIDDKTSVLIGHIKCNPSRIPVSFLHADKPLVFLYLNETFSASLKILRIHSLILNLTGYSEPPEAPKHKGEGEITSADITIFATVSCICLVLIIAGLSIFAKEIYRKKFSNSFSYPGSLSIPLKSEVVALRSIPTNMSDYKHVEMNEEAFVNEAYSGPSEDEYSSVANERKTTFPSSPPEETRGTRKTRKQPEKNTNNASKSTDASSVTLSNGNHRHESPGYGLIIGLMGYTKRLERQQQKKDHHLQQQKLQFEESSYYAVPQKRAKIPKIQDNTKMNASPTPPSYSPASRSVTTEEDSPVPPPRQLRTLHEVNETFESDEEMAPFINTPGTDNTTNATSRTDSGLDNPSFLEEKGRVQRESPDVFHF